MGHFDAVTLLAKGYLQKLANGALVVHHKNVDQFVVSFLDRCFSSLHRTSRRSWQFDNELRTAIFLGDHTDSAAMRLHDLIDDGKSQTGTALKSGLEGFENFCALFRVEADSGIPESNAQPEQAAAQCPR